MSLENILSQEIVQKLGWTLVHFVWQATAITLLLAITLPALRKSAAGLRYIIACLALGLMILLPIVTMLLVPVSPPQPMANIPPPASIIAPAQPAEEMPLAGVVEHEEPIKIESIDTAPMIPWKQRAAERLEPALPYVVSGWLIGVFGLSLWHLGGWAQLQRLRRKLTRPVDASLRAGLKQLADKLGVDRAVELLESALVQVPTVVGWLRPVILLPASALTGLSVEQLEALLAHELAHIRRCDYLVNMLQTVIETLGFYHPAVWWVSHKIRIERENCCDDLAVGICGDRLRYARALTSMEEIRSGRSELAVAASGGNLFQRIRRLVGKDSTDSNRAGWIPFVITILLIGIIAVPTSIALNTNVQIKEQNGQADTNKVVLKLVDPNSRPVPGAWVGTSVAWSHMAGGRPIWFLNDGKGYEESRTKSAARIRSNAEGKITLTQKDLFKSNWPAEKPVSITAMDEGHHLAGLRELSRADLGKEVTLRLQPASRVHGRVSAATARKWEWSTDMLNVCVHWRVHVPYLSSSRQGQFELVLPPGKYKLRIFSKNPNDCLTLPVLIKPGQGDLDLTTYLDGTSSPPAIETGSEVEPNSPRESEHEQSPDPNGAVLAKSPAPPGADKPLVQTVRVELSVVDVSSDSKMDAETAAEIKNFLGGKITLPDSLSVADLLRKASEATVAVKDESAGDKRVAQERFDKLFDLLVSRSYVKILMNPTLEVVEGQTGQIKTDQNSLEVYVNGVKDDIIYVTVKGDFNFQSLPEGEGQKPGTTKRSFANQVFVGPGQSELFDASHREQRTESPGNAASSQSPVGDLLCIVTASITTPPADAKQQGDAVDKNEVVQKFFKLKYYSASDAAQMVRPLLGKTGYVSADEKANTLLIVDVVENLKHIEEIIAGLDVPQAGQTITQIFEIRYGDPSEIVESLKKALSIKTDTGSPAAAMTGPSGQPVVLIPEPRRKWIIAKASAEDMKQVRQWIEYLDQADAATKESQVVQLSHVDANDVAQRINKALEEMLGAEFQKDIHIQALEGGRQIIIFGRPDMREIVKKLIALLDTTSTSLETRWDNFEVFKPRIIQLQNSAPVEMARLLTALFAEDGGEGVSIRDVILGEDAEEKPNIVGPLSSHFTFQDVPGTSRIIVISNIPEAYEVVEQLVLELDKQKMATKDVKQVRQWMATLIKKGQLKTPRAIGEPTRSLGASKLKQVGLAVIMYANEHEAKYPDSLEQLREYLKADDLAWAKQNIEYRAEGKTVADRPDALIAYDQILFKEGKGTNVLFNDSHVEFVKPERLNEIGIGGAQILLEARILTVSDEFMKSIGLDPNSPASSDGWADYLVHASADSASFVVDQLHARLIVEGAAAHESNTMLAAPKVLAQDGKGIEIHVPESENYYALIPPSEPNGPSTEPEAKSNGVELGTTVWLTPNLTPDGESVELDFRWEYRRLRGVKEYTGADKQRQKIPQIAVDSIKTNCPVPDGKTLLIAGKRVTRQAASPPRTPVLGDLPLVGRLFSRPAIAEQTRNLLILVKPVINPPGIVQGQNTTEPLPPIDPNDPLVKKLERKLERTARQR